MAKNEKSSLKMTPPASENRPDSDRPVSRDEFLKEAARRKAESASRAQTRPSESFESKEKPASRSAEPASSEAPIQDVAPPFPLMDVFFPPLLWKQMAESMNQWLELVGRLYRMDAFFAPFLPPSPNRPPMDFGLTAAFRYMNPFLQPDESRLPQKAADGEDPLAVIADALARIVDETLDIDKIEKKQAAGQFLSYEEQRRLEAAEELKRLKEKVEGMSRNR
ncbi:MAG: hypothetical protein ACLFQY_17695 [Desulfococcaceae bacterium]